MSRLIDADKLLDILDVMIVGHKTASDVYDVVDSMPTVDAVEVVRCKDCVYCKHFNDVWYLPKRDELLCTLYVENYHTTENDYCSRGERK